MRISLSIACCLLAFFDFALAHYQFKNLIVNGVAKPDWQHIRRHNNQDNPLFDLDSEDIRCNRGAQANAGQTTTLAIKAGSTVGFGLSRDIFHPSITTFSLAKAATASTATGAGPWFKIAEWGIVPGNKFGTKLDFPSFDRTNFTFALPNTIPRGDYLLRAENIALHEASREGRAEFYLSCAQITITDAAVTYKTPGPIYYLPGEYKKNDPGLHVDIYSATSYKPPGPDLYKP